MVEELHGLPTAPGTHHRAEDSEDINASGLIGQDYFVNLLDPYCAVYH